jgi:hypothetical protein
MSWHWADNHLSGNGIVPPLERFAPGGALCPDMAGKEIPWPFVLRFRGLGSGQRDG